MRIDSKFRKTFFLALFFLPLTMFAQYPINLTVNITTPHCPYITCYSGNQVLVTLQNKTGREKRVKLAGSLVGSNSGISVSISPASTPSVPIILGPNQTLVLSGANLQQYFNLSDVNKITVTGISKEKILHDQAMPEDEYTLCMRAYDFDDNNELSDEEPRGCFTFEVNYVEPPVFITPMCGDTVRSNSPQSINFSWSIPATVQSVNANTLQYKLKIVELIPETRNPDDAMNSATTPSFFEKTISGLHYLYGISDPALQAGHHYAMRVTAIDPSNKTYFSNRGNSEVCSFVYWRITTAPLVINNPVKTPTPSSNGKSQMVLKAPMNGYQVKTINGGNQFESIKFKWEDLSKDYTRNYVVCCMELHPGQTPEDAYKKQQWAYGTPHMFETDNYNYKDMSYIYSVPLKPDTKYAWRVNATSINGNIVFDSSEYWIFSTSKLTISTINTFRMNGYTIYVNSVTNKDLQYFSGTGYLYLWGGGPKINLSFNNLTMGHFNISGDYKGDWRCMSGTVQILDIINVFKNLEGPSDAGGNFAFNVKSLTLKAYLQNHFDNAKNCYVLDKEDPSLNSVMTEGSISWQAPFQYYTQTEVNSPFGSTFFGSNMNVVLKTKQGSFEVTNVQAFALKGSGTLIDIDTDLTIPKNSHLKLYGNWNGFYSSLAVDGNTATFSLSGTFSIPTGIGYEGDEHFDFNNTTSLIIPISFENTSYQIPIDMNTNIVSHYDKGYICLTDEVKAPGAGKYFFGVFVPTFNVTLSYKIKVTLDCKNAYNYGEGFSSSNSFNTKLDGEYELFPVKYTYGKIKIDKSILQSLELYGTFHVPFLETDAAVSVYADYSGIGDPVADIPSGDYEVYNKDMNHVVVSPYNAVIKNGKITLDGDFSFSHDQGKNVNVKGMYVPQWHINKNGDIDAAGGFLGLVGCFLPYETSGDFNGFIYKVSYINFKTNSAKTYEFILKGQLVLEEGTLSNVENFNVSLVFNNSKETEAPVFASAGNDDNVMAYIANAPGTFKVTSTSIHSGFNGSNLDFDASFIYYEGEDIYGSGFKADIKVGQVGIVSDDKVTVSLTAWVGHLPDFRYWYVEATEEGIDIETGILDLTIHGLQGRLYYHMAHSGEMNSVLNSDYVPDVTHLFGIYANSKIYTLGTNGVVLWGHVGTELTTNGYGAPEDIHIFGDGFVLSTGIDDEDAMFHGTADFHLYPLEPKFTGWITGEQSILHGLMTATSTLGILFSTSEISMHAKDQYLVSLVNQNLNGYADVVFKVGESLTLGCGFGGTLLDFGISKSGSAFGVCDYSIKAGVKVWGNIAGKVTYPNFQFAAHVDLNAGLYLYGSLCGISAGTGVGAWFVGEVEFPDPTCIAGAMGFSTPWPLPDISFSCRIKDGSFGWMKGTCAEP